MPSTKTVTPFDQLKASIDRMAQEFSAVLPENVRTDLFVRVLKSAISRDSRLLEADRHSLYDEALKCAQDGLVPDGREAVLNVYAKKVKYLPMIDGYHKRARNSGEIAFVDAQVIYEKDEYEAWTDENGPHFKHRRARGDRGKPILTFACAKLKSGAFYMEEIDEKQMADIESVSQPSSSSAWKGKFKDEMKRKSAFKRLYKRLPSSADLDTIVQRDEDMSDLSKQVPKKDGPRSGSRLSAVVGTEPAPPDNGGGLEATGGEEEPPI